MFVYTAATNPLLRVIGAEEGGWRLTARTGSRAGPLGEPRLRGAAAPAAEGGPRLRAAFFCGGLGAAFFCGGLDSASRHSCSSRFRASISRRCPLHDAQSGLPFPSQAAFASDIPVRGGWAADELLAGPWAQKCRPWGLQPRQTCRSRIARHVCILSGVAK